jgi:hypothetical protein
MRILLTTVVLLILVPLVVPAAERTQRMYRWVDREGIVHFGDTVPAEYMDLERQIVNEFGITLDILRAKLTEEEIAEEKRQLDLDIKRAVQARQDQALLSTYLSVDEIELHRDRRVELFQAQTRVTELYLSNLKRRLVSLQQEASHYQPYSDNPDAAQVDPELVVDITTTKDTIERHQANLERFNDDAQNVVARFAGDINRFKTLKGLN